MKGMGSDLIREGRRRRGLTQTELARLAGTTQSAIARLESGRTAVSFDDVFRYLRLMGLDLDLMLVERDDSDLVHSERNRGRSPQELHDRAEAFRGQLVRMRADARRSRA